VSERRVVLSATYSLVALVAAAGVFRMNSVSLVSVALALGVGLTALLYTNFSKLSVGIHGIGAERERLVDAATEELRDEAEPAIKAVTESNFDTFARVVRSMEPTEIFAQLESYEAQERDEEEQKRAAIEEVMTAAARWGYSMARVGFTSPPVPVITWSEDGSPEILYGKSAEEPIHAPVVATRGRLFGEAQRARQENKKR
jgi:hypothetical protein